MLKSITLENYKCFKDRTTIDIAPLTVLCGVNSSGKSSILKSLLMMKQTVEKDTPYNKLSFIGNYVDNGYFDDIINSSVKENDDATFTIKNTFVLKFNESNTKRQDISSFKELRKLYYFENKAQQFEITHTVTVKRPTIDGNSENKNKDILQYINNNDVKETSICIVVKTKDDNVMSDLCGFISITKVGNKERTYILNYDNIPVQGNVRSLSKYQCLCYFNNIKLTNIYQDKMPYDIIEAIPTILSLFNIVSMQYSGIEFVAPLRQQPMRNYVITGDVNSVGISGEDAPVLYMKLYSDRHKKYDIGMPTPNFHSSYNINFRVFEKSSFAKTIDSWIEYFGLNNIKSNSRNGLMSINVDSHNIADVGFGISQILPIIVQGIHTQKDEVLLLEQPEIHLHPKMQMQMADFLLAIAASERNIIVETHSDHIINRIARRVMETMGTENDLSDLVKIYFVYKDENNCSQIFKDIKIDPCKGLIDCPPEFFDQYGDELDILMQQGFENYRKTVKE